jgi:HEPN domain-containing protein
MKRGEFLRERAEKFLKFAKEFFERGEYEFSAFHLEQSVQLFLKHALWKKLGDFEKTHSIMELLDDLKEVSFNPEKIEEFKGENRETIRNIELAYIESRYFPVPYFKEQIERMLNFVEELKEIIKNEIL